MAIEPKHKDEIATLTLLKSHSDGLFDWKFTIKDYTRWIKAGLKDYFQQNEKFFRDENCNMNLLLKE